MGSVRLPSMARWSGYWVCPPVVISSNPYEWTCE